MTVDVYDRPVLAFQARTYIGTTNMGVTSDGRAKELEGTISKPCWLTDACQCQCTHARTLNSNHTHTILRYTHTHTRSQDEATGRKEEESSIT